MHVTKLHSISLQQQHAALLPPCKLPGHHHLCHAQPPSKRKDPVFEGLKDLATYLAPTVSMITGSVQKEARTSTSGTQQVRPAPPPPSIWPSNPSRPKPKGTTNTNTGVGAHSVAEDLRSAVYAIIAVDVAIFLLHKLIPLDGLMLGLGRNYKWWQVLTSGFMHTNAYHLAETVFVTYTFGRLLERAQGGWAVWLTYIAAGVCASLSAAWLLPAKAAGPIAASSAAAFGVFLVGLLWPRLTRKPLEVAALTPWVVVATTARYMPLRNSVLVDGTPIGHLLHIAGAVVASALVAGVLAVVNKVQEVLEEQRLEQERKEAEKQRAQRAATEGQAMAEAMETAAKAASAIARKLM